MISMYKLTFLNLCLGRFHTETAARMAAEVNKVQARVVKAEPYELPDFTLSHELKLYGLFPNAASHLPNLTH